VEAIKQMLQYDSQEEEKDEEEDDDDENGAKTKCQRKISQAMMKTGATIRSIYYPK